MNIAEKIADLAVKAILGQSAYANYQSGALPKKELQIYADGIQVLSKNYTEHQVEKQFKNKISDKVLAESYALYYAPVNSAKLCDIFQKTPALLTQRDQLKVLDYGAGPGTATLTLLFLTDIPIHITCIEHSPEMREIAESLFSELSKIRKDFTWRILNQLPQSLDADFDFIFLMNVLNELGLSESTKFLSTLKSLMNDGTKLAIVEPALKTHTHAAMRFRDLLLEAYPEISPLFPCFRRDACPMLKENKDDWCHATLSWNSPKIVSQLDQMTGFNKHRLKYCGFVFGKTSLDLSASRIILPPERTKIGYEGLICSNSYFGKLRVLKRHRTEKTKDFERSESFEALVFDPAITTSEAPQNLSCHPIPALVSPEKSS